MAKKRRRSILPTGALFGLLLGAVIVPAVLSIAMGIIALALWRQAFDIVFGVLVLCFATMSVTGGIISIVFLRKSARLAELQTDFVASVSHELRTPLAGIRLLVETLEMGRAAEPAQRSQVLERLVTETGRLEELVEQVLNWRRLETRLPDFHLTPQAPASLVEEAIDSLTLTTDKGRLEVQIAPALPQINVDRDALIAALRNLIQNALKFSPAENRIQIRVEHSPPEVIFAVQDQGPGFSAAEQKLIFQRFYRVPGRDGAGTGLGLAIVQRVMEGHGGRIHLTSAEGEGATFALYFAELLDPREGGRDVS